VCVLYYRNYITGTSYIPTVWTKQHGQTVMKLRKLRTTCQIYPTNELVCRHCGFVVSFVKHKTNVLSWEALSRGDKSTIKKACCTHGQLGEKHRLNDKPTARTGHCRRPMHITKNVIVFCLNPQIIHGDMKENLSGCFFSEHSV